MDNRSAIIDLHTHTTCSDGTSTPFELLELAKEKGLTGISITDHDTLAAYPDALDKAKELGLEIITGIEMSAEYDDESIHILGYSFDPTSKELLLACEALRKERIERNRLILKKLFSKGMHLEESDITDASHPTYAYGRVHIAQGLLKKGYVKDIFEAFSRFIGNGKSCYVQGVKVSVQATIDVIHQAKGFAVLAHPHLIASGRICRKVLEHSFDGIEAYYSRLGMSQHAKWLKIAEERGWFVTGGSDFHGTIKPDIVLGCSYTPEETFIKLKEHFYGL